MRSKQKSNRKQMTLSLFLDRQSAKLYKDFHRGHLLHGGNIESPRHEVLLLNATKTIKSILKKQPDITLPALQDTVKKTVTWALKNKVFSSGRFSGRYSNDLDGNQIMTSLPPRAKDDKVQYLTDRLSFDPIRSNKTRKSLSENDISQLSSRDPYYRRKTRDEPLDWWDTEKHGDLYTETPARKNRAEKLRLSLRKTKLNDLQIRVFGDGSLYHFYSERRLHTSR